MSNELNKKAHRRMNVETLTVDEVKLGFTVINTPDSRGPPITISQTGSTLEQGPAATEVFRRETLMR